MLEESSPLIGSAGVPGGRQQPMMQHPRHARYGNEIKAMAPALRNDGSAM
jgi:hypothetical protein